MSSEILYDAITGVKDELVEEAREDRPAKSKIRWLKFGAIAAAAVLVVGVGGRAVLHWGDNHSPGSAAGGSGHDDGSSEFMAYAGPVFPLTALEGGEGITAERALTCDFSPWTQVWWSNEDEVNSCADLSDEERQDLLEDYNRWYPEGGRFRSSTDLLVTDAYTLRNPTGEDKTVKVLYPFVSSLRELEGRAPTLETEAGELPAVLHAGGYSGGFQTVAGSDSDALLNLERLTSWEGYRDLLSDGRYLEAALGDFPDLSGTPVAVYKFTGYYGPEPDERAGRPNPTIRAGFDLDYDKTTVLSYGFHGMRRDSEHGHMIQCFSIPEPHNPWYGEPYYLFVVGEDIRNLTTGGYVTGGTDADTKRLDGCGVEVERYETDLESALRAAAELMYGTNSRFEAADGSIIRPEFGLYFGLMKEFLVSYGPLSESGPARYDNGWLGHMEFAAVDRVFYLEASVTVPAGGRVELSARMVKPPSYDFYCAHTENRGVCGYDMVTRLGTSLNITRQTARTLNTDGLEIVRQNCGFDWANGVNEVILDPAVEHYYLEMRRSGT